MPSVLIVDDDAAVLAFYRHLFQNDGFTVATAVNAGEGRRLCRELAPDILIVDQTLPDEDGLGVIQDSLSLPDPPATLLTSGAVDDDLTAAASRLGVAAVIAKGDSSAELLRSAHLALRSLRPAS